MSHAGEQKYNKHSMACKLSWLENAYSHPLFEEVPQQGILTGKVGKNDLFFGL